jgi:ankyrin repeat protein
MRGQWTESLIPHSQQNGWTGLHHACRKDYDHFVDLFIEKHANVNHRAKQPV